MDLRTIMNNDAAGTPHRPPSPPPQQSPAQSARKHSESVYATHEQLPSSSSSSYPPGYPNGPAQQPPSLQRAQTSPDRAASYGSLQSPYQYTGPQSQRGHSPPPAHYGASTSRDSFAAPVAYPHPQHQQPHQQSPIAPQRSHSIQSVLTHYPPASQPHPPRESPPATAQHSYQSQQFSPAAQGSLPGTPRGSAAALYHHSTPPSARPQSSGHDSLSHRASSPWVGQDAQMHISPPAVSRGVRSDSKVLDDTPRRTSVAGERRGSDESVSPKTGISSSVRRDSAAGSEPMVSAQLHDKENGVTTQSSRPFMQNPQVYPAQAASQVDSPSSLKSAANESPQVKQAPPRSSNTSSLPRAGLASSSPQPPKSKRRRYQEPPIFARQTTRSKGRCPIIPNRIPPIPKHIRNTSQNPWLLRQQEMAHLPPAAKIKREDSIVNGPPVSAQSSQTPQPPEPPKFKSLGPWEPSITGFIPFEEITKIVCDFLFQYVVLRNDAIAGPAGAAATGQGAIIEVEAKLGQLIDLDRGERLHLPIQSESIISRASSHVRTSFESNMTLVCR